MAAFIVTCPCCNGRLTIDPGLEAVVAHEAAPRARSGLGLDEALSSLKGAAARRDQLLTAIPNPPDPDAPDGFTDEDAVELRRSGDPSQFDFQPRDHLELAEIDMERGAKVSGSRFAYRLGDAAMAELALYRFALEDLYRQQEHVLDEKGEHLLSLSSRFSSAPHDAYASLSTADIKYPTLKLSSGAEVTLTYGQ